jgi:hypothetical protein
MYDPVRDCFNNGDSYSDKTPGKNPKEPKGSSDSEYYINKHGKKVKRYYKKSTEKQNKRKRELDKENRLRKAKVEGRKIIERESLVGLTEEQKKERIYQKTREIIERKRAEEFADYPFLKNITKRRKNKQKGKQEIEEFDEISRENRKKSKAAY